VHPPHAGEAASGIVKHDAGDYGDASDASNSDDSNNPGDSSGSRDAGGSDDFRDARTSSDASTGEYDRNSLTLIHSPSGRGLGTV
jgi:hypothetical protein